MFVPIHDTNPLKSIRFQYVTVALIALNVVAYLLFGSGLVYPVDERALAFALVPDQLTAEGRYFSGEAYVPAGAYPVPERFTLISYMFMHGSAFHLIGNMLFLWVFGDNVEDALGHIRFLMFYLMCGVFAAVVHTLRLPHSDIPLIGASGAVAGTVAAYLMLHPKVKIWVLALWRIPIRITAAWALGFWVLLQFANALFDAGENVAWWAHVGGLAAGALLVLFMRRRGVPLFDKTAGGA